MQEQYKYPSPGPISSTATSPSQGEMTAAFFLVYPPPLNVRLLKIKIQQRFSLSSLYFEYPFDVSELDSAQATEPLDPTWLPSVLVFLWLENWVHLRQLESLYDEQWAKESFPLLIETYSSLYANGSIWYDSMEIVMMLLSTY